MNSIKGKKCTRLVKDSDGNCFIREFPAKFEDQYDEQIQKKNVITSEMAFNIWYDKNVDDYER